MNLDTAKEIARIADDSGSYSVVGISSHIVDLADLNGDARLFMLSDMLSQFDALTKAIERLASDIEGDANVLVELDDPSLMI